VEEGGGGRRANEGSITNLTLTLIAWVQVEKEREHWKEVSASSHQHLTSAIEQATHSARQAFSERQEWQERCIREEAGRLEEMRLKEEALEASARSEAEKISAVDAAEKVLEAVILEANTTYH